MSFPQPTPLDLEKMEWREFEETKERKQTKLAEKEREREREGFELGSKVRSGQGQTSLTTTMGTEHTTTKGKDVVLPLDTTPPRACYDH